MKTILFLITTSFLLLSGKAKGQYCTIDTRYTESTFFDSTQISVGANIQYGIALDHLGNPDTLLMDLYYPNLAIDTSSKRPFIMLCHGGGFSSGDKQSGDIKDLCIHLAMRGFVCASINYRIGHDFSEYGQYKARYRAIQDGLAALRFIVKNANAVRIDTNWIFVGGQSAGSLVALGVVYADQSELDSVSLLYSATATSVELGNLQTSGNNLTNTYSIKGIFNNWGGVVQSEVDMDEMIPTIAFHGAMDTLVPIDSDITLTHYTSLGSRAIHYKLAANSICTEITIDTLGGHGIYRNASSQFRAQRASCFFKSVFCKNCTNLYTTDSISSNCSTPLHIAENKSGSNIIIYPNPFENSFRIDGLTEISELRIYNCFGQLVHKNERYKGETQIDLISGIYFLTLTNSESKEIFSTKLIRD